MDKLIYVAGPYSAGRGRSREANIAAALLVGSQVRWTGFTPLVPHIAVLPFAPDGNWKFSMRERLTMLRRSDGVVVVPADRSEAVFRAALEKIAAEDTTRAELEAGESLRAVFARHGVL